MRVAVSGNTRAGMKRRVTCTHPRRPKQRLSAFLASAGRYLADSKTPGSDSCHPHSGWSARSHRRVRTSRLTTFAGSGGCGCSRPMACKLLKPIFAPLDPQFGLAQHPVHKGIVGAGLVGRVLADARLELDFVVQGHGLDFMSQIGLQRLMGKREQLCILTLYRVHPTAYVDGAGGDGGGG